MMLEFHKSCFKDDDGGVELGRGGGGRDGYGDGEGGRDGYGDEEGGGGGGGGGWSLENIDQRIRDMKEAKRDRKAFVQQVMDVKIVQPVSYFPMLFNVHMNE